MDELVRISKALSDEGRVRALLSLRKGELCLCHIIELLGLAPSTVSKHMAILRDAGLVHARKQGRWQHYRLATDAASPAVRGAIAWVLDALGQTPAARDQTRAVRTVLKQDPAELCACYRS